MQGDSRRDRRRRQAESPNPSAQPWYRLPPPHDRTGHVLVIGGGLAGCCLARALAERGRDVVLLERGDTLASGASGNPAGVAKPFVTRAPSRSMDFYSAAFAELQAWLVRDDLARRCGYQACGALQLTAEPYPAGHDYSVLDRSAASELVVAPVPSGGIHFREAGWLNPAALCRAVVEHPRITIRTEADVVSIERRRSSMACDQPSLDTSRGDTSRGDISQSDTSQGDVSQGNASQGDTSLKVISQGEVPPGDTRAGHVSAETCIDGERDTATEEPWTVSTADGREWSATTLVLANGMGIVDSPWTRTLPLLAARGQISRFALKDSSSAPAGVVAGKHYVIPNGDTIYVGATFERDSDDIALRMDDHASNLAGLSALLPELSVDAEAQSGHAGVRATTPDRLPLVGPVADLDRCKAHYADLAHGRPEKSYPPLPVIPGLVTLGGFGSRGIVTAPFSARLVADWLSGGTELQAWMPLVHPVRFTVRALRRGQTRCRD